MAGRIRTIKPELLEDERVGALPHDVWRLFVSLFLVADDYGNFRANAKYLDGIVFWGQESPTGVDAGLERLAEDGLVGLYEVRGQQYGHLAGWDKHQRVERPGKPRCPGPEEAGITEESDTRERIANESRTDREPIATDLRPPTSDLRPGPPSSKRAAPRGGQRSGKPPTGKPVLMDHDWRPPDEAIEAQAVKWEATREQLERTIPETRYYWRSGKGAGKRRSPNGWVQTWTNRVAQLAKSGDLYVEPPGKTKPDPAAIARRKELEAEERRKLRENLRQSSSKPVNPANPADVTAALAGFGNPGSTP